MHDFVPRIGGERLHQLDLEAIRVEGDVAGQAGHLVERLAVGPDHVLEGRLRGRERPVVGLALEGADRVVVGRLEVLPGDGGLREVELGGVIRLVNDQAGVALGEHAAPEADAAPSPPRDEVDPIAREATPRGFDCGHAIPPRRGRRPRKDTP